MSHRSRVVVTIRNELHGPLLVTLGAGPRAHLAPFARDVAARVGVPLWSRDRSGTVEDLTDLVLLPEDEYKAGS